MPLTIQDLPTLSRLLDEAMEMDEVEQQAWLRTLPPEYARLKPKLREMLSTPDGMETNVFVKGANEIAEDFAHEHGDAGTISPAWRADSDIGGYRLIRELGLGGMGAVWLAERSDGELKRQVALKLPIFSIHNKAMAERFHRERDILASLTHPNIARLYDAGTTNTGQPYLALEHVQGDAITHHANAQQLTVDQRVGLFLQVLDAVQYAHSNLVLHRDLKPSNVMVTPEGQVKLLDFGIAKLISDSETPVEETELTQLGGHALTPDYASPEQIAGTALTTASDVYSLGVLLYEILVGTRPYKLKGQGRVALEEAILHTSAIKPSQMVRATGGAAENTAKHALPARKLAQQLEGDVDTILLKALKKNPAARYGTVSAFADDLRRYLAGETVEARPDSNWYRLTKLVRRNKLAMGSAAAVVVALMAGAGVATWQAQRATKQAAKSAAVQTFLLDIFRANSDRQQDPEKARNTTARELLDIGADRVSEKLKDSPEAHLEVLNTLAEIYESFSATDRSLSLRREILKITNDIYGERSERSAAALIELAEQLRGKSLASEQNEVLTKAERILDEIGDQNSLTRGALWSQFSLAYFNVDRPKAAEYARRSVDLLQKHPPSVALSEAYYRYGEMLVLVGKMDEALAPAEEAVRLGQQLNVGYSQLLTYKESLGSIYAYNLRLADAEKWMRDVVNQSIEKNGRLSVTTASIQTTLAEILFDASKLEEALATYAAAVDSFEKNSGGNDFIGSGRYWGYGRALLAFGNLYEAEIALRKARENRERTLPNTLFSARILETTAICLAEMGRPEEADAALSSAHELLLKFGRVKGSNEYVVHQLAKARVYFVSNRLQDAIVLLREIIHSGPTMSSAPVRVIAIRSLLAETLFAAGEDVESRSAVVEIRFALASKSADAAIPLLNAKLDLIDGAVKLRAGDAAGALPLLEKALTERAVRLSPSSPFLAEAYLWVARAKVALGKREEAGTLFKKASEVRAKNKQLGEHFERQFREVSSILSATR